MTKLTPIETWNTNPADIGPLYPYVGTEIWLCVLCVVFFVVFVAWKFKSENHTYRRQSQALRNLTKDKPSSAIPGQSKDQ